MRLYFSQYAESSLHCIRAPHRFHFMVGNMTSILKPDWKIKSLSLQPIFIIFYGKLLGFFQMQRGKNGTVSSKPVNIGYLK